MHDRVSTVGRADASLSGLRLAALMPSEDNFHNTEEQRFEQRFNFLQLLCRPEPMIYEHYHMTMDTGSHKAEHLFLVRNSHPPELQRWHALPFPL
jgi:hypothetical protein